MPLLDPVIEFVLEREGGFVDSAADRGGRTNFGITKQFLTDHYRPTLGPAQPEATDSDIDALNLDRAREVYIEFMRRSRIVEIDDERLRLSAFDIAVNSGASAAWKMVQRALIAL